MIIEVSNSLVSTVSQKISALERELGVQLLERTTRTFRATESGLDCLSQF